MTCFVVRRKDDQHVVLLSQAQMNALRLPESDYVFEYCTG